MKQKAEKNIHKNKLEKKNKKMNKEELEEILNNKNYDSPKKEKGKDKENIFTAGLSYEKIDQNKYNKALTNFNHLFGKDLNKINNNRKSIEKNDKKVQISKKFLSQRILYKSIEIEFNLENDDINIFRLIKEIKKEKIKMKLYLH